MTDKVNIDKEMGFSYEHNGVVDFFDEDMMVDWVNSLLKENEKLKKKNRFLESQLEIIDAMTKSVNSMIG